MLPRISFIAFVVALTACSEPTLQPGSGAADVVLFGDSDDPPLLHVQVADTDEERAAGLMGVEKLPVSDGMAFVFEEPTQTGFWMKDTLISLSIAFVGEDGTIVTIRDMQPCETDPCRTYDATEPFVLAIEANEGWFEDNGINVGDAVRLETMGWS